MKSFPKTDKDTLGRIVKNDVVSGTSLTISGELAEIKMVMESQSDKLSALLKRAKNDPVIVQTGAVGLILAMMNKMHDFEMNLTDVHARILDVEQKLDAAKQGA